MKPLNCAADISDRVIEQINRARQESLDSGDMVPKTYLWIRDTKPGHPGDVMLGRERPEGFRLWRAQSVSLNDFDARRVIGPILEEFRKMPVLSID